MPTPARLFRSRPRLRPAGRPQGPPLQSAVAFRCSPRSMLTRRGGACPRPPLSSPPQTPAVRAAIRAAPTENGWLPLLPSSNAHPPSIDRAVHIPRLEDAGRCGHRPLRDAGKRPDICKVVGAGLVPAHLFCSRLRLRTGGYEVRSHLCPRPDSAILKPTFPHWRRFLWDPPPCTTLCGPLPPSGPCGCTCPATRVNPCLRRSWRPLRPLTSPSCPPRGISSPGAGPSGRRRPSGRRFSTWPPACFSPAAPPRGFMPPWPWPANRGRRCCWTGGATAPPTTPWPCWT